MRSKSIVTWRAGKGRERLEKDVNKKTVTDVVSIDCGNGFSLIDMSKFINTILEICLLMKT